MSTDGKVYTALLVMSQRATNDSVSVIQWYTRCCGEATD